MKISIITFWQSFDNYGQILQAFALQKVLKEHGHTPEIIRYGFQYYLYPSVHLKDFLSRTGLKNIYIHINLFVRRCLNNKDIRHFNSFRNKYFKFSRETYNFLRELQANPPKADCYIAGSDQIWSQLLSNYNNRAFFLSFGDNHIRRIAYAPSFAYSKYPQELVPLLKEQLSHFDAISVREPNGVSICRQAGFEAKLVLDPTLLLSSKVYFSLQPSNKCLSSAPYCFIYHVNIYCSCDMNWDLIYNYNRLFGLKNYAVYGNEDKKKNMKFLNEAEYLYPSIEQWISLIINANYIATSSFHGIVFCILFHKSFVYCSVPESAFSANDRVSSLLSRLGISNRIIDKSFTGNLDEVLNSPINWGGVESNLNSIRKESLDFLLSSLNDNS